MLRYLIIALLLPACAFGAATEPEVKKSFSCETGKSLCISTKENCILKDKKKECTTSVDISCTSRGDEGGALTWQSKTTSVGNNTLTLNCQVSNLTGP